MDIKKDLGKLAKATGKLSLRLGGGITEQASQKLQSGIQNGQNNLKTSIDNNPNIDKETKVVGKGLVNVLGAVGKIFLTGTEIVGNVLRKEGER